MAAFLKTVLLSSLLFHIPSILCNEVNKQNPKVLVENPSKREWIEIFNDEISGPIYPIPHNGITHLLSTTQIFVGISSLRDDRCGRTLHSLITSAEYPSRISFGIVQQNDDQTIDCIEGYCSLILNKSIEEFKPSDLSNCKYIDNIRTIRMKHTEAKGPNLARGKQITLISGEDFCLQVDAHTFGANKWDTRILYEWGKANNEMAVLTTYIGSPDNLDRNVGGEHEVPHLCTAHLRDNNFPFNDRASAARYLRQPILCGLWAAGFSFSKCHAELRVPYDVTLIQIWTGEEFGRGARLWTNGYDFYTPTQPLIAHDYTPGKNQKKWNHNNNEFTKSKNRLQSILRMEGSDQSDEMHKEIGIYDIGTKRTLEQYAEFCGIDIIHKKELFSWCQDYKWVPYEMTDEEIEEIRRFGNPNYYKLKDLELEKEKKKTDQNDVDDVDNINNDGVRGAIHYKFQNAYVNEELIYNEIVGEIEHFQHSSILGKIMHIVVFIAFLTCFVWCVYKIFRKNSPKAFGDKQS